MQRVTRLARVKASFNTGFLGPGSFPLPTVWRDDLLLRASESLHPQAHRRGCEASRGSKGAPSVEADCEEQPGKGAPEGDSPSPTPTRAPIQGLRDQLGEQRGACLSSGLAWGQGQGFSPAPLPSGYVTLVKFHGLNFPFVK